ncbi:MAG: hypothetical protein ACR2L9_01805 [Solirubrobacteraceae bacterium]
MSRPPQELWRAASRPRGSLFSSAQHEHGLDRVLIVDGDVHHGNGTAENFCRRVPPSGI